MLQIVDRNVAPMIYRNEVCAVVYANVTVNFYAYNDNGNCENAVSLDNIQKVCDGGSLGGHTSAYSDFEIISTAVGNFLC